MSRPLLYTYVPSPTLYLCPVSNSNSPLLPHSLSQQIPVYPGAASALVHPFYSKSEEDPFHGHDGFGNTNLPHPALDKHLQTTHAAVRILEEAKLYNGRLN